MNYKLALFDRDGTLNTRVRNGYVLSRDQLKFPVDVHVLKHLSVRSVGIVTNQACVEMKLVSLKGVYEITSELTTLFHEETLLSFYVCPHDKSSMCECRKPKPRLIEKAIEDFKITKSETVFIGDSKSDAEAAARAEVDFYAVCWDSICWYRNCLHDLSNVVNFLNEGVPKK
jgi:D-glycero-D-manno-heptose 1,7-bisphosphate phosphatase